jgi:hypothetical protein
LPQIQALGWQQDDHNPTTPALEPQQMQTKTKTKKKKVKEKRNFPISSDALKVGL